MTTKVIRIWSKNAAIPSEHGSWVFLLSPLLIGLAVGKAWGWPQVGLILAAMAGFMARQPLVVLVKVLSKRRPKTELTPAIFWLIIYGCIALLAGIFLWTYGRAYILWLVLPALPVVTWHLWLVSRREERRKPGVEILGSAALALSAPAGYWMAEGKVELVGWIIWMLVVLQNAASIVYAYLRLEQRVLEVEPDLRGKFRLGSRALLFTTFNLALTIGLGLAGIIPVLVWLAFVVQWLEAIFGTIRSAIRVKPVKIGVRQMIVSIIFTIVFILTWMV